MDAVGTVRGLGWPIRKPSPPSRLGWPETDYAPSTRPDEDAPAGHAVHDVHRAAATTTASETAYPTDTSTTDTTPADTTPAGTTPAGAGPRTLPQPVGGVTPPTQEDELTPNGSADVSRETSPANRLAPDPRPEYAPESGTMDDSSHSSNPQVTTAMSDASLRAELLSAVPPTDDDTPLAKALAVDTKRRIALTNRTFPKPTRTRILTVANQKGGVGKTTTAVNIAAALAQSGLQVLVVDLDPQGNASTALGIDHHAGIESVYDVLVDDVPMVEIVQPSPDVTGLFCAPSSIDLAGAEIELVSLVARENRLAKAIRAMLKQTAYDYIFIDCPPSLGLLTINAFVAAQEVFIPIQCEYYALEGLSQLLRNIELIRTHLNPTLAVSTILLTMYDARTRLSAQVADEVRNHFPRETLDTTIPRSVRVSEAPSFGQTVMTYDPLNSGALAYLDAASQIADRGAQGVTGNDASVATRDEEGQ